MTDQDDGSRRKQDRILEMFERGWRNGKPLKIEECLSDVSSSDRTELLHDLIEMDIEYRWKQLCNDETASDGVKPEISPQAQPLFLRDYQATIEELNQPFPDRLVVQEFQVRTKWGDQPDLAEFAEEYQIDNDDLIDRLRRIPRSARSIPIPELPGFDGIEAIGQGGMGLVYRARNQRMDRTVAIKLIPREQRGNREAIRRFEREMKAAAALAHPNVVTAFHADEVDDSLYLETEYIQGRDLARLVREDGPLAVERAVDYVSQAATGLSYAHSRGVIHRDVKPANLMLDERLQRVRVVDFGLARFRDALDEDELRRDTAALTQTGAVMGTVDYMAPEQAEDTKSAGEPADVYSLGCVLYYLLTGEPPYPGNSLVNRAIAHRSRPIPYLRDKRPRVSAKLEKAFRKALAKDPADRFQTMDEFRKALGERPVPVPFRIKVLAVIALFMVGLLIATYAAGLFDPEPQGNKKKPVTSHDVPASANAPFDVEQARSHQAAWAKHLRMEVEQTNVIGMKMRLIPPGDFLMGTPQAEINEMVNNQENPRTRQFFRDEGPQHSVRITEPFQLSATEVTRGQFARFVKETKHKTFAETGPDPGQNINGMRERNQDRKLTWRGEPAENLGFVQEDDHPVINISREDAKAFCRWLSKKTGHKYRLPTEEEWEFACRAGTTTRWSFGEEGRRSNQFAWAGKKNRRTNSVARLGANPFGLHDMHGNVEEWCQDDYKGDYKGNTLNKPKETEGVTRGGNFAHSSNSIRSATRHHFKARVGYVTVGFRVVRELR